MKNFKIREAVYSDAEALARSSVKAWQESYKDILPEDYLSKLSVDKRLTSREAQLLKPDQNYIHLVATFKEKVIGFCDAGLSNKIADIKGEVYTLYLLDGYKMQGLGTLLWEASHNFLKHHNFMPFSVWVLEDNLPARKFYEKQGGKRFLDRIEDIGGKNFKEIAYIFTD